MKSLLPSFIVRNRLEKELRKAASPIEAAIHRRESVAADAVEIPPPPLSKRGGSAAEGDFQKGGSAAEGDSQKGEERSGGGFASPVLVPPSIGLHNQSLMTHLTHAKRVAVILARRGCVVQSISITPGGSLVLLKSSRGSRALGGEQVCHAVCGGKDERTYQVLIDGVRVQWTASRSLQKEGAP